jgi:hypothetical protein
LLHLINDRLRIRLLYSYKLHFFGGALGLMGEPIPALVRHCGNPLAGKGQL